MPMWLKGKQFSGDGTLRECSTVLSQGFEIGFPGFDPSQPYRADYRISNVPQVSRTPRLCVAFRSRESMGYGSELMRRLTARIRVNVKGSHGQRYVVDLTPSRWGSSSPDLFHIYEAKPSGLRLERGESYSLSVEYMPGTSPLPGREANFQIDACAGY